MVLTRRGERNSSFKGKEKEMVLTRGGKIYTSPFEKGD
jgi:hypothetical protein